MWVLILMLQLSIVTPTPIYTFESKEACVAVAHSLLEKFAKEQPDVVYVFECRTNEI